MKQTGFKQILNRLFLLTIIFISSAWCVQAQTKSGHSKANHDKAKHENGKPIVARDPAGYIDVFFKKYKTSTDSAIDYLFSTNKLFAANTYQVNVLKSKLDSLRQNIGDYVGVELITQKSATPSLVLYSYLVKHENQPVRFTFMFYKPKTEWVLYRFNYDDEMDAEMLEAAKINNKRY